MQQAFVNLHYFILWKWTRIYLNIKPFLFQFVYFHDKYGCISMRPGFAWRQTAIVEEMSILNVGDNSLPQRKFNPKDYF